MVKKLIFRSFLARYDILITPEKEVLFELRSRDAGTYNVVCCMNEVGQLLVEETADQGIIDSTGTETFAKETK